jgi:hypothetical protein
MRDWMAHLESAILQAPPGVAIVAAIFLFVVVIRLVLALPERPATVTDDGLEAEARRWIGERIDEHVDVLADAYGEDGMCTEPDDLPPGFALTIESFIGDVLLRELDSEGFDVDLRGAVREFAVLHRAEIYEDVTTRIRKVLAAA